MQFYLCNLPQQQQFFLLFGFVFSPECHNNFIFHFLFWKSRLLVQMPIVVMMLEEDQKDSFCSYEPNHIHFWSVMVTKFCCHSFCVAWPNFCSVWNTIIKTLVFRVKRNCGNRNKNANWFNEFPKTQETK